MTSRLNRKEHKGRIQKQTDTLSSFQHVLKNGFYPNGFSKSSSRKKKAQRYRTRRNHRLYEYFPSRKLQHQKHIVDYNSDNPRRKYYKKHRRKTRRPHTLSSFRKRRKCKRPQFKYRKHIIPLKHYRNEKCDHNRFLKNRL